MGLLIRTAFSAATGWLRREFSWVILLVVAVAITSAYVAYRQIRADRDDLLAFAERTCASAGQGFDASDEKTRNDKGKPVIAHYPRGKLCGVHVADLASFRLQVADVTSATLADARVAHEKRVGADLGAAQHDTAAGAAADLKMEERDAQIAPDDRVDGNWFAAFNDVAGVHPPAH